MKYLKLYENLNDKCYWITEYKYLGLALKKLELLKFLDLKRISKDEEKQGECIIFKNEDYLAWYCAWCLKTPANLRAIRKLKFEFIGNVELSESEKEIYLASKKFGL